MEELKETKVEEPKKKKNRVLYYLVVFLVTMVIMILCYNIGYKLGHMAEDNGNSKVEEKESNSNINEESNTNKEIDIKTKLGSWYESEQQASAANPNSLIIKNYENDQLLIDLYFTRVANIDNAIVSMNGNKGTFKAYTENGVSTNDLEPQISASIEILEDSIKLDITYSNVEGLPKGSIVYNYQKANTNIDDYKGIWYVSENEFQLENATTMNIKSVEGNKIVFDSYITRVVDLQDVNVYLTSGTGTFNIVVEDCTTVDEKPGFVTGFVTLNDNKVELNITTTNIANLPNGTKITFTYKK